MNQPALFLTDVYDALSDLIRVLGGPKSVGIKLRPEKPADEAAKWVKDCLNRERREKFDPEQVLWLLKCAKAIGHHDAINYLCGECGYSNPQPIEPEDELGRMLREYLEISGRQEKLAPKIEEARLKLAR